MFYTKLNFKLSILGLVNCVLECHYDTHRVLINGKENRDSQNFKNEVNILFELLSYP